MFADTHVKNCDNVQRQAKRKGEKAAGYLFKYSRRRVHVIVGPLYGHTSVLACARKFLFGFSRCIASFPVSMRRVPRSRGGVHRRRALFVAYTRMCNNVHTFARVSVAFSLSLPFSLPRVSFPFLSGFSTDSAAYFFFFFLPLDFPPRPIDSRPLRVFRQRIKGYIRAGCLAHIARGTRVWSRRARAHTARKEKRKNSKSKAPWLVIHRRSAPAVRRHYLRVSRHSELLIRPDAGGKCAPTIQPAFLTAKIGFEVLTR